jgi:hypothetical protein
VRPVALLFASHADALERPERAELIQMAQEAKAAGDHARALRWGEAVKPMTASLRRFRRRDRARPVVDAYSDAYRNARGKPRSSLFPNHDAVSSLPNPLHAVRDRVGLLVFDFPSPLPADLRVTVDDRLVDDLLPRRSTRPRRGRHRGDGERSS